VIVESGRSRSGYDWAILIPVSCLLALGLAVAYSAGAHAVAHHLGDRFHYLERQALFCLLGCGLLVVAKNVPCTIYPRLLDPLLLAATLLLLVSLFFAGFDDGAGNEGP
jgi:cell division protein FtsW